MARPEELTDAQLVNLKNALEHIEELKHLMNKRPVETFKELLNLDFPMMLEIEVEGGIFTLKINHSE